VEMLEPIHGSFAEGLATPDLKEAAALLDMIRQTTLNQLATDDDQNFRVVV
jgi:hypothetical protein